MADANLTIREFARMTGLAAGTLRMWETRYGFPVPRRLPSGHRRYGLEDVERVRQVVRDRDAGLSMRAAIERSARAAPAPELSVYAGVRRRRPEIAPYRLPKRTLIGLSHAIEDECCARAERPVLCASFQRERFYRDSERRWRELARTAQVAIVFADFPRLVVAPDAAPAEVPIDRSDPFGREWSIVCDAPGYAAFLAGWELPGQDDAPDFERRFETIWSVDPELVREAIRICIGIAAHASPELVAPLDGRLDDSPPPSAEELRLVDALTSRMVAYVGSGETSRLPPPQREA